MERTILAVTDAIERLSFNVGLARLMELSASATTERAKLVPVRLRAPFAPHLADELWERLGPPFSVHTSSWPVPDLAAMEAEEVTIAVQLDGRVRAHIQVNRGATEADVHRGYCGRRPATARPRRLRPRPADRDLDNVPASAFSGDFVKPWRLSVRTWREVAAEAPSRQRSRQRHSMTWHGYAWKLVGGGAL